MLKEQSIVFLGAGSMAEALLRGIVGAELVRPDAVVVLNRQNRTRLEELHQAYGIRLPETNDAEERLRIVSEADIVVLAMKPKDVRAAFDEFGPALRPEQLLVSVIAGLSIPTIEQVLQRSQPIVRTMPNTGSTIGLGATGVSFSSSVSEAQRTNAIKLLEGAGLTVPVDESMLNIVTGVSGSGPAYLYYIMEAMIEAGVQGGLSPKEARDLVVFTFLGAAHMVHNTGEAPEALRAKVTSPNGTTFAALQLLEERKVGEAFKAAVQRASERAGELGDDIAKSLLSE